MRIRVSQQTVYAYDPPAKSLIQTLRLTPRNHDGQFVVRWRIDVDVDGRLRQGEDAFANITHQLSAAGPLERVTLIVEGEVETHDTTGIVRGTVERFPAELYLRDSSLAAADETVRALADAASAQAGADRLACLHALMADIHGRVSVAGPDAAAGSGAACLAAGAGTPEDIAHLFIAAARHVGIPSRYVSGFVLRDGDGEAQQNHGWAEAHVERLGWIAFDPTVNLCPAETHVRVAVGIDSLGAAPIRGASLGGGPERRDVLVDVRSRDLAPEPSQSQSQSQAQT